MTFMNDAERFDFVLRLAGLSLENLREGDKLNLLEDTFEFLALPPASNIGRQVKEKLTLSHLVGIQADLQYLFRQIVQDLQWAKKGTQLPSLPIWVRQPHQLPEGLRVISTIDTENRKPVKHRFVVWIPQGAAIALDSSEPDRLQIQLIEFTDLRAAFRMKLTDVLARVDISKLRLCPGCSRVFLTKNRKREFCGDTCKAREMQRRYRGNHRKELADKAHRFYQRKIEAKSKGKVQRRSLRKRKER